VWLSGNLNNKTRGSTERKKTSFKELGNLPGFEEKIARMENSLFEFKMRNIRSNKIAYSEITNETMIKIVMLMRDFCS
jgi:hypothetical protein